MSEWALVDLTNHAATPMITVKCVLTVEAGQARPSHALSRQAAELLPSLAVTDVAASGMTR